MFRANRWYRDAKRLCLQRNVQTVQRSFEIGKQFAQVLNSLDPRVVEKLIIGPMGHEDDRLSVFRHIAAILVPIIDEEVDVQFADQLRLMVLCEINHRIADPMFPKPITGDLVDTVVVTFISVRHED